MRETFIIAITLAGALQSYGVYAQEVMELRGKSAGCDDNQKMGLWDLSSNSPLIRNDMLRSSYCFTPTLEGLKVQVIEYIGKFARIRNLSNNAEYLVYRNDLRKVEAPKKEPQVKNATGLDPKLKSVTNLVAGEVYEINGKPTVQVNLSVNPKFNIYFLIPKFAIDTSFDEKIINQNNPKLQVGGKCSGQEVGVGAPDWYRLKIIELDNVNKVAKIEVSGSVAKCSLDNPSSYSFANSEIIITGKKFNELVRPHTAKEMSRVFKPFKW